MDRREFNNKLKESCPNLYRHGGWAGVGEGWYDLLWDLSVQLEETIKTLEDKEAYYVVQIKEKFGGLRFYMNAETKEMSELIDLAETASYKTCENCGALGKARSGGWIKTLCDKCNE